MSDCSWIKYVPIAQVETYEAAGWRVIDCRPDHHSAYSVTMEYDGDGDPPWMSERKRFKEASDRVAEAFSIGDQAKIAEEMAALGRVAWNLTNWVLRE